ncbi:MAG: histone deacetylase [Dissulfurispiraceae bacterium]|jgi:acetoin utilization deacetylase AcuC-like enzyme|nr:histone deacetylase [Dissulfurispiraceae bacterium]
MIKTGFVYDDFFLKHTPPDGHPDSGERLLAIIAELKKAGLWDKLIHIKPKMASYEDIGRVHSEDYINKLLGFGTGFIDEDTYISEETLSSGLYATGAVIEAVSRCRQGEIQRAFCAVRPPGHHAEKDVAMGFCIFNNVAVGARYAQSIGYNKVFVIDFDAHHGNGTQHIFEDDDSVFFFSTHQFPYYPDTGKELERGREKGEGFTYNVTIKAGSGNKDFLYVYQDILPGLIFRYKPDIVLVSAGYDIHTADPFTDLWVSGEGVRGIVQSILSSSNCPVVFTLEGGYDPVSLAECVRITIEEMLKNSQQ